MVDDFKKLDQGRIPRALNKDDTKEKIWMSGVSAAKCGRELREYIEDGDEDGAYKVAKEELVRVTRVSSRVIAGCARVRCQVITKGGQLCCDFTGEGDNALEDAKAAAGYQAMCNGLTYMKNMETHPLFLALSPDLQRDAKLAKEGKRFDHETFEGHGHVTVALPPGTRVSETKKEGEKWEYITASGTWRKARDRADAEEKALNNPYIRELVRRMKELENNLRKYDQENGNATGDLGPLCMPQFFEDRDKRDGRGFNSEMFDVDAAWKFGGLRDVYAVDVTHA